MLSWLTGGNNADEGAVPHYDDYIETPETPAPVFAVRAFKHAIFGTPKPLDTNTQSHFDDIVAAKTLDSTMPPPAAAPSWERKDAPLPDTLGFSPTKPNGILMTPGTTRRNKTVTFGAQVVDNEGKKQSRSGLPNTFPGKFPSPWTPKADTDGLGDTSTGSQKRTKLTQTLLDVRESSRLSNASEKPSVKSKDDLDITLDYMEPRSQSGRYWKQEYEAYAEKTQREVKRLLMKQKSAKDYAKSKDTEVIGLEEKLRQEKRKVKNLEARTTELEKDLKDMKTRLDQSKYAIPPDQNEASRLRLENWKLREQLDRAQSKPPASANPSPRRRPAPAAKPDIWADAVMSSPFVVDVPSPKRVVDTPSKNPSPLTDRDINILQTTPQRSGSKRKQSIDSTQKRSSRRSTPRVSREPKPPADDTLDLSIALPQPSPEPLTQTPPRSTRSTRSIRSTRRTPRTTTKTAADKTIDDLLDRYSPSKSMLMSSPPPKFDRMALPIGMPPPPDFSASTRQPQSHRKRASRERLVEKVVSPKVRESGGDDGQGKKRLDDDRKRAAMERIAARRLAKSRAA